MITLWILFGATGRWLLFLYGVAVEKIIREMWPLLELESRNSECKRLVGETKYCEASRVVCLGNFWGSRLFVSVRVQKLLALDCCRVGVSAQARAAVGSLNDTRRVGIADAEVDQGRGCILSQRKNGRSWCVGADRARPRCAWQCEGRGKLSMEQAGGKCLARLPSVLFLLERKRTKKFKRVRTDTVCGSKCPLTNSRLEESIVRKA
jgi:hypothetical protein